MKHFIILLFILISGSLLCQTYQLGIRIQKTQTMYWENGISLQYSFKDFKPKQFYVGFAYVTTRLGSAIKSNALKQDNYLFNSTWAFRHDKPFGLMVRLNMGYFIADYEEDFFSSLPNTAFLLSPEFLFNYHFDQIPMSLNLGTGYYLDFAKEGYSPGTFQPLYYHLDVHYTLFKSKTNE